jgi:hypothetical protein
MNRRIVLALALALVALPIAAQPKYGVTVTADKGTDFKTIKTYVWQSGWDANDRKVHTMIVGAIDKELKALGLERKSSAPADVVVKYAALRRIDVQVSTNVGADVPRKQLDVGSLVVLMLQPGTSKELLRARVDQPIEVDLDKVEATINHAVGQIFAQYPTRAKK